jgi:Co/Zn/Cd efflux system component
VSHTQRLTVVLLLNLGLVAVGLTAHSLAVLAEGATTSWTLPESRWRSAAAAGVAVLLDTIADAAAAVGVAATGGIILATGGWYWLDPAVALVIAVVIGYHALALLLGPTMAARVAGRKRARV